MSCCTICQENGGGLLEIDRVNLQLLSILGEAKMKKVNYEDANNSTKMWVIVNLIADALSFQGPGNRIIYRYLHLPRLTQTNKHVFPSFRLFVVREYGDSNTILS